MARSPLTETIERVQGMITYVRENLSGDEYNLFLDLVDPQPEQPKQTRKRKVKKTISGNSRRGLPLMCAYVFPDDGRPYAGHACTAEKDGPIHDKDAGYAGYHPFQPPASARRSSKSAQAAVGGSSASNGEASTTANFGDGMESALGAAHGAGGGVSGD